MTLIEVLAQLIERDYVKHRNDRDCTPERESYTGRAVMARAERWAKAIEQCVSH